MPVPYTHSLGGGGGHAGQEIPIISYSNDNAGDENYQYSYETGNGITVQETGHRQGESESVNGFFSYTWPDNVQYSITYTADEYGFHHQGTHAVEAREENQDSGSGGYSHGGNSGVVSLSGGHSGHGGSAYQGPNLYQSGISSGGYQYQTVD
ncbi:PREDICTED: LOW QUALITY PROTEIN: pupal cuticle protein 20 [Wasmannia auropunctata]|uniref:LOW QUALITY PROTEIN: pupal cuticle protein 20 n=1 Tax=Wasmannia auropunctata TaxID=64793 RepID=UPI0005F01EC0|nr:PREDICTED: LOW QUALITY PROTEIN: pupal cuticle protein 20 [Wasmannia auropunctata]